MAAKGHSELEGFVLGLVWQAGACSPYDVRRRMQESPSSQWSASTGAIYPLMTRLARRGLLRSRVKRTGERERREYEVTPKGERSLRRWIGPPLPPEAVTVAHDPLRSRARFLAALTPVEQMRWIESARAALDEVEARVRAWEQLFGDACAASRKRDDPAAKIVTLSGRLDVRSRRAWLGAVRGLVARNRTARRA